MNNKQNVEVIINMNETGEVNKGKKSSGSPVYTGIRISEETRCKLMAFKVHFKLKTADDVVANLLNDELERMDYDTRRKIESVAEMMAEK